MPKNPSTEILRRWQALDYLLSMRSLEISTFAKRCGVSIKTVRRDLRAFRELGQKIVDEDASRVRISAKTGKLIHVRFVVWGYSGCRPLFVQTLNRLKPAEQQKPKSKTAAEMLRNARLIIPEICASKSHD
jgi:hypothetical protein